MQSIPLAVLKQKQRQGYYPPRIIACNPYRLRYWNYTLPFLINMLFPNCMQSIPLAVLKQPPFVQSAPTALLHAIHTACGIETCRLFYQCIRNKLHAIHTACGIETATAISEERLVSLHAIHTACGIETISWWNPTYRTMGLHAIHTACGIETLPIGLQICLSWLHAIHTACGIETECFP